MNIQNPVYANTLAEHIYDDVNENQEVETKNKSLSSDFPRSANRGADCDTIKSDVVNFDESSALYNANASEENAENYETLSKSKNAKKPISMPVAEDHHRLSTSESLTSQDEYLLPDIKYVVQNQSASQGEPQRAENDPYTPLIASQITQPAVYQQLVGQKPPHSS